MSIPAQPGTLLFGEVGGLAGLSPAGSRLSFIVLWSFCRIIVVSGALTSVVVLSRVHGKRTEIHG